MVTGAVEEARSAGGVTAGRRALDRARGASTASVKRASPESESYRALCTPQKLSSQKRV